MKKDILIVEDEPNIAQAQALVLEDNFNVHRAADGEEGLKKAREIKPDLIVLDLMLPKINGYDLCSMIRKDKDLQNTKIVMVTARNQEKDEEKGMERGADDYVMKPFEADEFLHVINQVLK